MSIPAAPKDTAASTVPLKQQPLLSIASTVAIVWGALLLLSGLAIGAPLLIKGNHGGIIYILFLFLLPGLFQTTGGIGIRRHRPWASGLVFATSAYLFIVSLLQLMHGVPIAMLGILISIVIIGMLYMNSVRSHQGHNENGV